MGAEAGGDAVEVCVVVARMATEFVSAGVWQRGENAAQCLRIEHAGCGDGDRAICREDAVVVNLWKRMPARTECGEEADGSATLGIALMQCERPGGLEGIADSADAALFRGAEQRAGDGGEDMRVLVRIDMGDGDAGGLELADLGDGFAFDLF